ncbi:MAG TPA: hypothetical protein VJL35_14775, partial [Gemmatimonadaceae bacterium]|nr:hypothetical protein [Gemmatimonadaceae bacterium]
WFRSLWLQGRRSAPLEHSAKRVADAGAELGQAGTRWTGGIVNECSTENVWNVSSDVRSDLMESRPALVLWKKRGKGRIESADRIE